MKKTLLVLSVVAMALIAGSGAGLAYPTLSGPTGGAVLPDAMVVPPGQLDLAVDWTEIDAASLLGSSLSGYDLTVLPVRLVYGVGSGAELWAAWTRIDNSDNADGWGVGAKYQLMREPEQSMTLALGGGWSQIDDASSVLLGGALGMYDVSSWNVYLVATKDLSPAGEEGWAWENSATRIVGSVGVLYQKFEDIIPGASDDELLEPFVGLEFIAVQGTRLGLEYRFKDSDLDQKGLFSAVLRHPVSENLTLQVGMTNGALAGLGGEDFDLFAGLNYRFGLGLGGG